VHVNLPVPEQTQADITLKKLNVLQDALHEGILKDSAEKIKEAVFAGADINCERNGASPLLWSIMLDKYNAVEALLQSGAKPDEICVQKAASSHRDQKRLLLILVRYGYKNYEIQEFKDAVHICQHDQATVHIDLIRES
jgi:hypothetical protein